MQSFGGFRQQRWFLLALAAVVINAVGVSQLNRLRPASGGAEAPKPIDATALGFLGCEPRIDSYGEAYLCLKFTAPVATESAVTYIEVSPKMEFRVEPWTGWDTRGCKLVGSFAPSTAYQVTLRAGLTATNGTVLVSDIVRVVSFPDRPASLALGSTGHYLSSEGNLRVPVTTVNVRKFTAAVERVYPNNLVYFSMRESGKYRDDDGNAFEGLSHEVGRKEYAVAAPANQSAETLLNLRDFLQETPTGAFNVTVKSDNELQDSHLVIVTDTGIAVKMSPHDLLVWANSIHTLAAVTGAEVRVFSKANQELLRGVTDTNGLVRFEAERAAGNAEPFLVTVSKGSDLSYLKLDGTRVDPAGDVGGRSYLRDGYEAFLFTDRGIYRPGETAHLQVVVRGPNIACPPVFPVQLHVIRPDGKRDRRFTALLSEFGTAEFAVDWADYAATGSYQLQLTVPGREEPIGATAVAVEEFVPPQIAVKLEVPKTRGKAGETFPVGIVGMHLFGRPAAGNAANARIEYVPEPFAPPGWAGYAFGDSEKGFGSVREELGSAALDADGKAMFTAKPVARWRPPAAVKAVIGGTVMETGGRSVSAYASRLLDVYPFYVGLKLGGDGGTVTIGQTQTVAVATVAPDGKLEAGTNTLQLTLAKTSWATVLQQDSAGRFSYHSERQISEVLSQELHLKDRKATATFIPKDPGQYLLTVRDAASESSSSISFYVGSFDQQWQAWSMENPDRIDLELDRDSYSAGDEATLVIKAPFAGKALLTIESDHVLEQRVLSLEKNTAEIKLPVLADYRPNVYCSVSLIRSVQAGEKWTGHRAIGWVPLVINSADRRLAVKLAAPKEIRPRQRLSVAVSVAAGTNEPAAAEIVVAAVDEGICTLTDFACPDPTGFFWGKRRLEVDLFDLYGLLMPEVDEVIRGSSADPGGDKNATMLRRRLNPITARRFKPVALWSSAVRSDTNGQATVSFDVPEFTGQLRLMAVAVGRDRFGSAQSAVLVKRSLVVRSSLPRFLAPADVCRMPVQVFNETGHDGEVVVQLSMKGLSTPASEKRVSVKDGQSQSADFELAARPEPGRATVSLVVTLGAERYTEDFELAVRPAAGLTTMSSVGTVAPGGSVQFVLPADWLPGTTRQEIWCSGMPALKLGGGLDYLLRYPYGCIEQTTSAAFPLLYLDDLAARLRPGSMGHEEVAHFVQAGIRRVLSMQLASGGFSFWPHSSQPYDWGSIYATHFLAEAAKAGYAVPHDRLDAACDYLVGQLSKPATSADDLGVRSYTCLALAVAGKPERGWTARLAEQRQLLDPSSQVNIAGALAAAGRRRDALAFLTGIDLAKDDRRAREIGGCLNSSVRDQALLLSAWLDLDPAHPMVATLVRGLESAGANGRWATTQENALAITALGKYARSVAARQKPFQAVLVLPAGKAPLAFTQEKDLHLDLDSLPGGPVCLTNAGPGTVYYYWRSEGVPNGGPTTECDRGLSVRRRLLDLDGEPLERRRFKQGELFVVELTVDAGRTTLENIVLEDLLPAGLEVENTNLKTSQLVPWLKDKPTLAVQHTDIRDDRLLVFTGTFTGQHSFYYAVRAVTIGDYVYPAIAASCMYDPEIRSIHGKGRVQVE